MKKNNFKGVFMKKRLLIVLSLILASLLLVVSCEGSPETVEGVVLPEGAPSNVTPEKMELITAKPEEPKQGDRVLIQTLVEEAGKFVKTDDAQKIVNDFVMAVFKKGIEIKGPNYSIAMVAKADSMKAYDTMEFIASVSLDNFEFAGFTLDGSLDFVAKPDSSNSKIPFSFEARGETGMTISYGEKESKKSITIKSSGDYEEAKKFFESLPVNPDAFIEPTNKFIPVFIESLNETFREYTVSTDLLTFISSDKISGTIKVGKEGVDFGDGLTLDSKVSAFTLKPLEFNGSQYKAAVFGTMNTTLDNNEKYNGENEYESPITSKGKAVLNAFIETSGKVGDNKIQIQAQLSNEEKDNAFYLVINDKVLDLKALIPPETK